MEVLSHDDQERRLCDGFDGGIAIALCDRISFRSRGTYCYDCRLQRRARSLDAW